VTKIRTLVVDDETLARERVLSLLQQEVDVEVVGECSDGGQAVTAIQEKSPDLVFLDVQMPGCDGFEVLKHISPDRMPTVIFVTAYDEYALQAFDAQAMDYVLKPVQPARLRRTVDRLRDVLAARAQGGDGLDAALAQLRRLMESAQPPAAAAAGPLKVIQAGAGSAIRMVPVDDVIVFEAADKYVRVLTEDHEHLIRTPLRELLPRLDTSLFWQVHRGTVVRATAIESVVRDESGRLHLLLRGRPEKLPVSRLYAHLFKAM
jgi:DNA-binding LytR/AlgR family response regulator